MYDKKVIKAFLDNQLKLFPEKVAEDEQEAAEFLEDVYAVVCKNKKEVLEYLEDEMDISGMSEDEILSAEEVFAIGDGRYLIVEG
jgi:hypothetical protein